MYSPFSIPFLSASALSTLNLSSLHSNNFTGVAGKNGLWNFLMVRFAKTVQTLLPYSLNPKFCTENVQDLAPYWRFIFFKILI